MTVINLQLMRNPLNWLTVALWLFFLGFIIMIMDPHLPQPQVKG